MDPNKKISFGFNKLAKKPVVFRTQPVEEKKVELVECLEGQSIKIKDAVEIVEEPLVIPLKDNKKNLLDRVKEAKSKQTLIKTEVKQEDDRPDSELTLDELAARSLINDAKNRLENRTDTNHKVSILPIKEEAETIEGEKEPTLEDYENVPISDYGMAMLRGMGWKEGMGIGKNSSKTASVNIPELRPKGLGLGATKIVKVEEPARDKKGNALILKRGTYAKIIAGVHKGNYCEVQGLDDEAGRVIVKTSLKGEILTLNEFLIVPVTKEEYSQGAKVLNNAKYEEYKEKSDKKLEAHRKADNRSKRRSDNESEDELKSKSGGTSKQIDVKHFQKVEDSDESSDKLSSEDEHKKKPRKRNRNSESTSDDESSKNNGRSRSKHRDKRSPSSDSDERYEKSRSRHRDSSDSDSKSKKKRNKDKKKKKDRHRDRSKSRKEWKKSSKKKSERERRTRDRSPSYDYKGRESSKKHKSKSRHRRRSNSKSSDEEYRKSRK